MLLPGVKNFKHVGFVGYLRINAMRITCSLTAFTLLATATLAERLPRAELLTLPDGRVARTAEEWEARRKHTQEAFISIAGPMPSAKVPLEVQVTETTDMGTYTRQLITYATDPGNRVPAYLCLPKTASRDKPAPAALCLHPTNMEIGHKVVVGLGGKENRQYAAELAERGFITLSPAYTLMANYQPDFRALGYQSGTMKSVWDNRCGLDLLDSMPEVDKTHGYAAIGHSLGGHNAIYTAVFDERIKVIVSSCGFDSYTDYYGGNITGWTQDRYMPKLKDYLGRAADIPFDFYELIACLAPRAIFVNAPLRDANFRHDSVKRIMEAARPVWMLHKVDPRTVLVQPDCEHDFPDEERRASYKFIESILKPGPQATQP